MRITADCVTAIWPLSIDFRGGTDFMQPGPEEGVHAACHAGKEILAQLDEYLLWQDATQIEQQQHRRGAAGMNKGRRGGAGLTNLVSGSRKSVLPGLGSGGAGGRRGGTTLRKEWGDAQGSTGEAGRAVSGGIGRPG